MAALVDDEDYERVSSLGKWSYERGYAVRQVRVGGRGGRTYRIWMHRFVLGVEESYPAVEVDHRNHNGLDNRKRNLRRVTKSQNQYGRSRNANKKSSRYKGVFYDPSPRGRKPWRVKVRLNGSLKSFGRYASEEEAAKVYDKNARELFGTHAKTNFEEVV